MTFADFAANRVLEREPWARERLAPFAGRSFVLRVGPAVAGFRIDEHGLLETAPLAGATPDLALALSPFNVPAFLADPKRWNEFITEDDVIRNEIGRFTGAASSFTEAIPCSG